MESPVAYRTDWVERLSRAVLTHNMRRWVRQRRAKSLFLPYLRTTDVFIVGHPKSGNTWLAYMLAILLTKDRDARVTFANLREFVPYIHGQDFRIASYRGKPDPRIFRNENPLYQSWYPKTIYLVRDPRSVLVSFYHMYRTKNNDESKTLHAFLDEYLSAKGCFTKWNRGLVRWDRQVSTWTKRAEHDETVLVVKYEEMVDDRQNVLERVMRFSGIPCIEENLALAVERGGFNEMQRLEDKHGAEAYSAEMSQRSRFIRRGKIDGWKDEVDPSLVRRIEQEFAPIMKSLGYLN